MPDQSQDARKLSSILTEKVRDTLGVEGRQALFSAACLMAFADLELAERESTCISALTAYLSSAPQGTRVTTRRQSRDQILATFRGARLSPEAVTAVLGCLAYVALADGVVKPVERELLDAIGEALGQDSEACEKLIKRIAVS
jgi:uncharacterized tellurite resistance protein B-like protein